MGSIHTGLRLGSSVREVVGCRGGGVQGVGTRVLFGRMTAAIACKFGVDGGQHQQHNVSRRHNVLLLVLMVVMVVWGAATTQHPSPLGAPHGHCE